MARKANLTLSKGATANQRQRTKNLLDKTDATDSLQTTPPKFLSQKAKYIYNRIVPLLNDMGVVKQTELDEVCALVIQIEIMQVAYENIQDNKIQSPIYKAVQNDVGDILEHSFQGYKKNPAVVTLDSAIKNIKSISNDLGLTPASRATLLQNIDGDEDSESLSDMINKGAGF